MSQPRPRLDRALLDRVDAHLAQADAELVARHPGEQFVRRPIHTVYLPAGALTPDPLSQWGSAALALLDEHCPDPAAFAQAFGVAADEAPALQSRVRAKLATEPIEDLRIDLEDGYGSPGDEAEDADARAAGRVLATIAAVPFLGIRFKSLEAPTRRRGLRTLDLVLGELLAAGPLPVGSAEQVLAAWRLHTRLVGRALERGYYQGWDLHPGQLPSRYAATHRFYADGVQAACARVRAYVDGTGTGVVDEPATAQALAAFLVRGLQCGALDPGRVSAATGLVRSGLDALLYRRFTPGSPR